MRMRESLSQERVGCYERKTRRRRSRGAIRLKLFLSAVGEALFSNTPIEENGSRGN